MATDNRLFKEFLESEDTFWACSGGNIRFRSTEKGIKPLFTYIQEYQQLTESIIAFDRVVGNAAALLLTKVDCKKIYSPLGSELAVETLRQSGIAYSFLTVVPYISNKAGDDMCPFEKASIGKSPDEFYQFVDSKFKTGNKLK